MRRPEGKSFECACHGHTLTVQVGSGQRCKPRPPPTVQMWDLVGQEIDRAGYMRGPRVQESNKRPHLHLSPARLGLPLLSERLSGASSGCGDGCVDGSSKRLGPKEACRPQLANQDKRKQNLRRCKHEARPRGHVQPRSHCCTLARA